MTVCKTDFVGKEKTHLVTQAYLFSPLWKKLISFLSVNCVDSEVYTCEQLKMVSLDEMKENKEREYMNDIHLVEKKTN